jgi:hypothetical protein
MKYFWALILNLLYVFCYEKPLPGIIVAVLTAILLYLIYSNAIKHNSVFGVMLELLCFTFPFAWRSIFGSSFADFGICWFYVIGLIYVLISLTKGGFAKSINFNTGKLILVCCIFLIIGGLIPLFNSYNFIEGAKKFTAYIFFYVLIVMSLPHNGSISQKERYIVLRSFTYASLYSAVAVIIQFLLFNLFRIKFLDMGPSGSSRYIYSYMYLDISAQTLMLITGAMICLVYGKKIFKYPFITMCVILLGTILTSARTGIVAFALISGIYLLVNKNSKYKLVKLFIYAIFVYIGYLITIFNRTSSSFIKFITNDNGRIFLIKEALALFLKHPFLGIGFDLTAFIKTTDAKTICHFYLLNVLLSTGLLYTLIFVILITFILKSSLKIDGFIGVILPGLLGSCFVPDLMGAKFFIILVCIVILSDETAGSL